MDTDPQVDRLIGTSIGPWRVEAVLGAGGMGRVYKAVGADGTTVALKMIKPELAKDSTFRRRFDREVRIACSIEHPNVVPLVDHGEFEGIPYLAQKLIAAGSLEDKLRTEGPLDVPTAVKIATQVASALDVLWQAGLVHRDIKPGNILLDEADNAYLIDFGLAKDTRGTVLTRPGQALGSMDYMAPEQIRAEDPNPATDVYALSCVMFECLTGAPPFADRQGMNVVLWAHMHDDPGDPCEGRPDIPARVGAAIRQGLEKNAAKRPQSAGEFARVLAEAAGGGATRDRGQAGIMTRPDLGDLGS